MRSPAGPAARTASRTRARSAGTMAGTPCHGATWTSNAGSRAAGASWAGRRRRQHLSTSHLVLVAAFLIAAPLLAAAAQAPAAPDYGAGGGACDDAGFGTMEVEVEDGRPDGGACLVQQGASWLDAVKIRHPGTPSMAACCAFCAPAGGFNASMSADLTDPICVFSYCDASHSGPCEDGGGHMLDPGMCIVGERGLPFSARRPPLFFVGSQKATSVTGTTLSPTVAALAATRPPPGFVFAGPRSFFLSSFNGRCRYDSDAAFNASVADPTCVAKGTLLETLAACRELPDCGAVTYYPVKDGPFAGGIGRFTATLEPAFQALPGVGFLKYGPATAECASMSPYSVLFTREGGPPSAAAAAAGAKAGPWLENLGTRVRHGRGDR